MLVEILKMILRTSKGGLGRQKIAYVREQIFGEDCRGGCMHKQGCQNERAPVILLRLTFFY